MGPISTEDRVVEPAHFLFKVKPFSLIPNTKGIRYNSYNFQASGHTWRLILYPYGDNTSKGNDHISLFLELLTSRTGTWSVLVDLKFFVYNYKTKKYLTIQDSAGVTTFRNGSTVHGFSQILPLDKFKNSGYLDNDSCRYGVEVFEIKTSSRGPGQTLALVKDSASVQPHVVIETPNGNTYSWQIKNFKDLGINSVVKHFYQDGINWEFSIYLKGANFENISGKYLSLFISPKSSTKNVELTVEFSVVDSNGVNNVSKLSNLKFKPKETLGRGYRDFMLLSEVHKPSNGYLKDGGDLTVQIRFDKITVSS